MEAAWIGLLGALIGGAIGLLGPWLLQRRKEAEEKRHRRAEKFEELVAAVYEFDHRVGNQRDIAAYGRQNLAETPSPFAKIEAIVVIYFPQFGEQVRALDRAFGAYNIWMRDAGLARLEWLEQIRKGTVTDIQADLRNLPEFSSERTKDVGEPYVKARADLLSALRKFGNEGFAKSPEHPCP
jgi:hypothetical protein